MFLTLRAFNERLIAIFMDSSHIFLSLSPENSEKIMFILSRLRWWSFTCYLLQFTCLRDWFRSFSARSRIIAPTFSFRWVKDACKMSTAKVEKSKLNLVAKNSVKKAQSKFTIECRDVVILCLSFVFTIVVACSILFYIHNNQQKNVIEIENIVGRILDARGLKLASSEPRNFERKRGYLDEQQDDDYLRKKRAVPDSRNQLNGETCEWGWKVKNSQILIRTRAADCRVFQSQTQTRAWEKWHRTDEENWVEGGCAEGGLVGVVDIVLENSFRGYWRIL